MIEVAFGTLWGGHVVVGAILLLSSWTSPTLLSMLNLILQPVWCFVNKGRKLKKKKKIPGGLAPVVVSYESQGERRRRKNPISWLDVSKSEPRTIHLP